MSRLSLSSLEILENRIAPAGASLTFVDADGDTVKISSTKGTLADLMNARSVVNGHLDSITLGSAFSGAAISITVTALGPASDGLADVGWLDSGATPLASVVIKGNLGKITGGNIGSLTLDALGGRGDTTGAGDFESTLGDVGTLKIFKNLDQSHLSITGTLKTATIGGSLVGGAGENSGSLDVFKTSGTIKVGGSLAGAGGNGSGAIRLFQSFIAGPQKCGTVIINGSLQGGTGGSSGSLVGINFDAIFVGGSIFGNTTPNTGMISASSVSKSLVVSGSIFNGIGSQSGSILLAGSSKTNGSIFIGGDVTGFGPQAGLIKVAGKLKSATVMGSVRGGISTESGSLILAQTDTVYIGGNLEGGFVETKAGVVEVTGNVKTVTIGGSIIGGGSTESGRLRVFGGVNTIRIGGDVSGNVALDSGSIFASVIGSLIIGGDVDNVGIGFGSVETPAVVKMVAKSVVVGGSVSGSYFDFGTKTRSDIQVGTFLVNGDWNQSDLFVGAINLGADNAPGGGDDNFNFGDSHDALAPGQSAALPTINSIVIEGTIRGDASQVHYGFVAGKIGAFRAGSVNVLLAAGAGNDLREIGGANVSIHEIGGANSVANPTAPTNVVTFLDTDGDLVKVTSSKGTRSQLEAAMTVTGGQLQKLDLTQAKNGSAFVFAGANISISVLQLGAQGNGTVDVGFIDATGFKLGNVLVKGDLAKIVAGSDDLLPGLGTLTVNSLGLRGTGSGAPNINSEVTGNAGALKVFGDVAGDLTISGKLASATILGDLAGGSPGSNASITVDLGVGTVLVGGSLEGGSGGFTGSLTVTNAGAGAITIGGSLKGTMTAGTASIFVSTRAASLTIGGGLSGSNSSGTVALGSVGNLTIGGSIRGTGMSSGSVEVVGNAGIVKIGGGISGDGDDSGNVHLFGKYTSVTIQGGVTGGPGNDAGTVQLGDGGAIFVGGRVAGVTGATNGDTGGIFGGKVGAVTINGGLFAGDNGLGGTLHVTSTPSVKILGSVAGGYVPPSGNIRATASLGTLDVSGDVNGARILIGAEAAKGGSMVAKSVHVGGSVLLSTFSFGSFVRQDVAVGTFTVDGNWTTSNLLVGAANLGTDDAPGGLGTAADNVNFGDAHDVLAGLTDTTKIGTIASIVIEGRIVGTTGGTDHFGFVASEIKAFRAGSVKLALTPGKGNDAGVPIGIAGDLTVKELL